MEELRLGVVEAWLEKVDHLHGFKEAVRTGNLSERKRNGFRPDDERGI